MDKTQTIEPTPIQIVGEKVEAIDDKIVQVTLVPEVVTFTIEQIQTEVNNAKTALDTLDIQHNEALQRLTNTLNLWQGRLDQAMTQIEEKKAIAIDSVESVTP